MVSIHHASPDLALRSRRVSFSTLPLLTLAGSYALLSVTDLVFYVPRLGAHQTANSHDFEAHVTRHALSSLEKTKPSSEWRLDVGHAIDVLRRDTVGLFGDQQYTPDFSIFDNDITIVDARLPDFKLKGLATYQYIQSTLQWSVHNGCVLSNMAITSMTPPVNNEVYVRWRLQLWPKELQDFWLTDTRAAVGEGVIFEGYSRYEFHPWTAQIVKHTIDITNPPMYITDLISRYAPTPSWITLAPGTASPRAVPYRMSQPKMTVQQSFATAEEMSAIRPFVGASITGARNQSPRTALHAGSWMPSLPQSCEDDFECNDGKANFPLQCCEIPLIGGFCCEPPDYEPVSENPAYVPLPVPVQEPWMGRP